MAAGRALSPEADRALEQLCRTYWYPLYAFLRRQGKGAEEARDLTQEFFARFLEKQFVRLANPARGRFRSFLLTCLANFSSERHRYDHRLKRGGSDGLLSWDGLAAEERYLAEPMHEVTPETLYEKQWALTLLESVLNRLTEEQAAKGKDSLLAELKPHLWGDPDAEGYSLLARRLQISESAVKVTVHRLRRRFGELLREEVARTVSDSAEIEDELRHLIEIIRR